MFVGVLKNGLNTIRSGKQKFAFRVGGQLARAPTFCIDHVRLAIGHFQNKSAAFCFRPIQMSLDRFICLLV
jgi:hypothetical protein